MAEKNELISYAMDLASYLVIKVIEIDRIILYGSISRGDFDSESDIDLFIDSRKDISKKIEKNIENYKKTSKYREWELKNIKNDFHIIVGELDSEDWKDLKRSILNNGITVYGKYKADIEKAQHYILFSFENIKPDKKRIVVFRKIFGFKNNNKNYPGLLEKTHSIRIGKGIILTPIEYSQEIKKYFNEKKVGVKLFDIFTDNKIE